MKGRVAAMTGLMEITIKEYDVPKAEKGAVVLEIIKSNICGSDVHMWEGKHIFKNHVLGHEMVGRLIDIGEGIETDYAGHKVSIGDRVVPVYYITCQKCSACLRGDFNICERGSDYQGQDSEKYPHFTGGFSTHYVIQPNQYFYVVPDCIPDNVAAGANCGLAQILYSLEASGLKLNDYLVIQGAGGLGLFASAIGKTMGATVIVIDGVAARLEEAERFGADHIIDMKKFVTIEERLKEVSRISGGLGADVVLDVAGVPEAFEEGIYLARTGGTLVELGNVLIDKNQATTVIPGFITRKCLTVKGVLRYQPWYLYKILRFLEKYHDKYPFNFLSERIYTLDQTQLAMQKAHAREEKRAIIEPNKQ